MYFQKEILIVAGVVVVCGVGFTLYHYLSKKDSKRFDFSKISSMNTPLVVNHQDIIRKVLPFFLTLFQSDMNPVTFSSSVSMDVFIPNCLFLLYSISLFFLFIQIQVQIFYNVIIINESSNYTLEYQESFILNFIQKMFPDLLKRLRSSINIICSNNNINNNNNNSIFSIIPNISLNHETLNASKKNIETQFKTLQDAFEYTMLKCRSTILRSDIIMKEVLFGHTEFGESNTLRSQYLSKMEINTENNANDQSLQLSLLLLLDKVLKEGNDKDNGGDHDRIDSSFKFCVDECVEILMKMISHDLFIKSTVNDDDDDGNQESIGAIVKNNRNQEHQSSGSLIINAKFPMDSLMKIMFVDNNNNDTMLKIRGKVNIEQKGASSSSILQSGAANKYFSELDKTKTWMSLCLSSLH